MHRQYFVILHLMTFLTFQNLEASESSQNDVDADVSVIHIGYMNPLIFIMEDAYEYI